jgi:peptide/nickel transport system substrate-binding protein
MSGTTRRGFNAGVLSLAALSAAGTGARAQDPGRPFTVALAEEPDTLDPILSNDTPIVWVSLLNIVEPLVGIDTDGNIRPGVATWHASDDGRTIEFKIREGVTFHSGDPLTAEDLAFSHARSLAKNPFYKRHAHAVERVEVVDRQTFRVHFNAPDAVYLPTRAFLVESKAYHDRVGEEAFVKHPVGTGPYKFAGYTFGQYLDFAAFDHYWGGAPQIKQARFVFVKDDTTRLAKLRAGEADLILGTPFPAVEALEKAGFRVERVPVNPSVGLYFDLFNSKMPWGDLRVRQAMAYAIDGEAIVKGLLQGIPTRYPWLAPGEIGYDPSLKFYPYDPAKAKALLKEAGYANGFTIPLYYSEGQYYGIRQTVEAVALYFHAIGIKAEPRGHEIIDLIKLIRKAHADPSVPFAAVFANYVANTASPVDALGLSFWSKSPFAMYNNPAFDKPYEEAKRTLDNTKRGELIRQAIKVLDHDKIIYTLWDNVDVYAMNAKVHFKPTHKSLPMLLLNDMRVS